MDSHFYKDSKYMSINTDLNNPVHYTWRDEKFITIQEEVYSKLLP